MALRLCSVVDGGCYPCEVVSPSFFSGDWYFYGITAGQRYRSELGWWENGEFYPLLCSDIVDVPPEKMAWQPRMRAERRMERNEPVAVAFVEAVGTIGVSSGVLRRQ